MQAGMCILTLSLLCLVAVASETCTGAGKTGERTYDAPGLQRTLLGGGFTTVLVYCSHYFVAFGTKGIK